MLNTLRRVIPKDFPLRLWYHHLTGWLAALYYGFPSRRMTVIGVTGTNGKTTVTQAATQILTSTNIKVGMASTVEFRIGDKIVQNESHKTTLGRFHLQKLLKDMKKSQVEIVVMEVSSHALSQGRLNGIDFDTAVFTNLSREHLDYHRTMEKYFLAKKRLFERVSRNRQQKTRSFVINIDDKYGQLLLKLPADQIIGVTTETNTDQPTGIETIRAEAVSEDEVGLSFKFKYQGQTIPIQTKLRGRYNASNLLLAAGIALTHGVSLDIIKHNLQTFTGVPGRLEMIGKTSNQASVYIDYAVTPDSFRALFTALKDLTDKRLIAVFGACGDRDQGKRPKLGQVAGELCDLIIVTNEEPYTENPEEIIDMIWSGVKKTNLIENKTAFRISDRSKAIEFALKQASENDIVVVTGMGDQTSMVIGDKKIPWSDRETIIKYM